MSPEPDKLFSSYAFLVAVSDEGGAREVLEQARTDGRLTPGQVDVLGAVAAMASECRRGRAR